MDFFGGHKTLTDQGDSPLRVVFGQIQKHHRVSRKARGHKEVPGLEWLVHSEFVRVTVQRSGARVGEDQVQPAAKTRMVIDARFAGPPLNLVTSDRKSLASDPIGPSGQVAAGKPVAGFFGPPLGPQKFCVQADQ